MKQTVSTFDTPFAKDALQKIRNDKQFRNEVIMGLRAFGCDESMSKEMLNTMDTLQFTMFIIKKTKISK